MKSKYGFWKHGLNSLAGLACLAGLVGLTGCKELNCDFSYSPTQPVAGQVVTFSNMSEGADDYSWTFGDNSTSTTGSPTHIYRKPGTYTVTLLIKRNKVEKRSRTQHITVIDTIPTIACDTSTIYTFSPQTFYAQIYNPWKKNITYKWTMPDNTKVLYGTKLDSSAVVCYFTKEGGSRQVKLHIQMGDEPARDLVYDNIAPLHKEGTSVLYVANNNAMEQFTYTINKKRTFHEAVSTDLPANLAALTKEQDSTFYYGYRIQINPSPQKPDTIHIWYTKDTIRRWMQKDIRGFQVDRLMSKVYAYDNSSLYVCNFQGNNLCKIADGPIQAIKVDGNNNCLYWATDKGIFARRLLRTYRNQDTSSVDTLSSLQPSTIITKLSVNSDLH